MQRLREDPLLASRIVHWHSAPARPGRTREWPAALDPRLVDLYRSLGIDLPYAHQARAVERALAGADVLVATPTASGKTLAFTAPVLQALLESDGAARALFLYPTKALTQDQSAGLNRLIAKLGAPWHSATYDGDTPPAVRRTLRQRGHLILTNPYMLHQGILPNHAKWAELFRDLRYVVVDEVHTLSGVLGSNVAGVLRRLERIAAHYGSRPQYLASSATIPRAPDHAARLFGRPLEVIDEDASPSGARTFGVYNPPIVDPVAGLRASALEEARELARVVCGPAHQTIFFCGRRTAVEVLTRYLKEGAAELGLTPDEVRGYRGGYLPGMRREIESGLKDGSIRVVVSTSALELGIDIGSLDVCVLVGYPGNQASFWQRAGRVGRRGRPSLVLQIARSEPVDQFLAHHPEWLFEAPHERLAVDPDNLVLLSEQLKCAAFELPFEADDEGNLIGEDGFARAPHAADILDYLAEESGLLTRRGKTWFWMADAYPAQDVSLDGGEPDNVLVLDLESGQAIGEVDRESSITQVHQGAIYQVQGVTWRIERFDHRNRRAYARKVDSDYFTDAQTDTEVRVLRIEERALRRRAPQAIDRPTALEAHTTPPPPEPEDGEDYSVWHGEVHVTTVATLFKKIRFYTRENVGAGDIHLPAEELDTEAFVLTLSDRSAWELGLMGGDRGAAWRALGSLLRRLSPLVVRCAPGDLGLSTQVRSPHFSRPTIFLYDRIQGGVGLGELVFDQHRTLLAAAREVVERCDCQAGCPACVGPLAEVGPLGKEITARLLTHLTEGTPAQRVALDGSSPEQESPEQESPEEPDRKTSGGALP